MSRASYRIVGLLAALAAGSGWLVWRAAQAPPKPAYTAAGYGGYVRRQPGPHAAVRNPQSPDPVRPALEAYDAGRYEAAEQAAQAVIDRTQGSCDPAARKQGAKARWVLAFSAARRKQYARAREQFAVLRQEASELPDRGKPEATLGENPPTLEEEGAYQHAVLTAAIGDRQAAEAEYVAFMRRYPESPLVHAAVKRIARFHGGDVPKEAEAVWKEAMRAASAREEAGEREAAKCGPECLAELLRRRQGEAASVTPDEVEALAREMGTDRRGTTLKALAGAARKRGFRPRGLQLTWEGLRKQRLPLLALLQPAHFVLVDELTPGSVRVWDPDGAGTGRPSTRSYYRETWQEVWQGVALALR
jgi:TolA-binding protein